MLSKKLVAAAGAILLLSTSGAMAQSAAARAVLGACKPDIRNFCSQVAPGSGRIKACMKEHLHELSEPCKEAMFQAWLRQ
jgi:Cysteine rich repeat